jgi:hypothetical protein
MLRYFLLGLGLFIFAKTEFIFAAYNSAPKSKIVYLLERNPADENTAFTNTDVTYFAGLVAGAAPSAQRSIAPFIENTARQLAASPGLGNIDPLQLISITNIEIFNPPNANAESKSDFAGKNIPATRSSQSGTVGGSKLAAADSDSGGESQNGTTTTGGGNGVNFTGGTAEKAVALLPDGNSDLPLSTGGIFSKVPTADYASLADVASASPSDDVLANADIFSGQQAQAVSDKNFTNTGRVISASISPASAREAFPLGQSPSTKSEPTYVADSKPAHPTQSPAPSAAPKTEESKPTAKKTTSEKVAEKGNKHVEEKIAIALKDKKTDKTKLGDSACANEIASVLAENHFIAKIEGHYVAKQGVDCTVKNGAAVFSMNSGAFDGEPNKTSACEEAISLYNGNDVEEDKYGSFTVRLLKTENEELKQLVLTLCEKYRGLITNEETRKSGSGPVRPDDKH